jgi:hypothetical protein
MNFNQFSQFLKNEYTAMMYYKGTPCPLSFQDEKAVNEIKKQSEDMIKLGLKTGVSIKEQINDYISKMDYMEQKLIDSQKKGGKGVYDPNVLTEQQVTFWWLFMFALIRLKKLKSDNMNGLSIIDMRGNTGIFRM